MTKKLAVPYWLSVLYILWLISVLYQLKINLVRWEFKFFCKFFKSILILNYMYIKSFILWSFLSLRHYMNTHVYFKTVCACASIWQSMYIQYSRFSIEQYGTITSYLNLLIQQCRGLCNNILQSLFKCGWGGGCCEICLAKGTVEWEFVEWLKGQWEERVAILWCVGSLLLFQIGGCRLYSREWKLMIKGI